MLYQNRTFIFNSFVELVGNQKNKKWHLYYR